ncbi:MAG TPA: methyltransferase domain-containing protein [Noviherbaspirillum sp.]|uniref:methyltransferase domain-containing protein n=1 Tax=Noviherbaspirillum sp. TaxID=1926288 RepID=UPI002B45FEE6|nr:methyltransferase domain-containing protein [Noviherbaspirillum sp.]HJV87992.1 methyltransferase domain-containing protein [Noviherbaspirillum sp.]
MPSFASRDPSAPEFWSERFEQEFTPWDRGDVPEAFRHFVEKSPQPYVTLIPGCGTGYEVACLSEAGWDVTAIDFSPAAVDAARKALERWAERVVQADFFGFAPARPVELIYERAFFCALPRQMRQAVVNRWAELLPPGGLLAGFFFFDDAPKGPPFGIVPAELENLLTPFFERIADEAVADSLPVFAGRERWQVWRRKAH